MSEDHRREALDALAHFRQEVEAAGFAPGELAEILGHVAALESEVASAEPSPESVATAREFLDDLAHTPAMTNAIAKVVQFFNSIGL